MSDNVTWTDFGGDPSASISPEIAAFAARTLAQEARENSDDEDLKGLTLAVEFLANAVLIQERQKRIEEREGL